MTFRKNFWYLTLSPPCHCHKLADFVPLICFLGTPLSPPTADVIYGSPLNLSIMSDLMMNPYFPERNLWSDRRRALNRLRGLHVPLGRSLLRGLLFLRRRGVRSLLVLLKRVFCGSYDLKQEYTYQFSIPLSSIWNSLIQIIESLKKYNNTVVLGYCDYGYCDKLLIVTVFRQT